MKKMTPPHHYKYQTDLAFVKTTDRQTFTLCVFVCVRVAGLIKIMCLTKKASECPCVQELNVKGGAEEGREGGRTLNFGMGGHQCFIH